ncbi:MAG: DNA-processing protein DprA, partial [Alkalispirochaeta sp.]
MSRVADHANRREELLERLFAGVPRPDPESLLLLGRTPALRPLDALALLLAYPGYEDLRRLAWRDVVNVIRRGFDTKHWNPSSLERYIAGDLRWLARSDRGMLWAGDRGYPQRLFRLYDPPPVLFAHGDITLLAEGGGDRRARIAVVGTRRPDRDGLNATYTLGAELAGNGVDVVSGLARGIDGAAHRGVVAVADQCAGRGIAVLGSGIDTIYPPEHRDLVADLLHGGGVVVGEYHPGRRPAKWQFPARNRIIVGLSDGVVLMQAPERSGALISADLANDIGVDVAVHASGADWTGGATLVVAGAPVVRHTGDLLSMIPGGNGSSEGSPISSPIGSLQIVPPDPRSLNDKLLAAFGPVEEPQSIDEYRRML